MIKYVIYIALFEDFKSVPKFDIEFQIAFFLKLKKKFMGEL